MYIESQLLSWLSYFSEKLNLTYITDRLQKVTKVHNKSIDYNLISVIITISNKQSTGEDNGYSK